MKLLITLLILLLFLPISTAEELQLQVQPPILDTYFLYSGMGDSQTSEYRFISNRVVSECEMIPADNIECVIEDEFIIKIWYSCSGQPFEGTLKITDDRGFIKTTPILIRLYDFGIYANTSAVHVGSITNSSEFNYFFATDGQDIVGIRWWLIIWILILFAVVLIKVYL